MYYETNRVCNYFNSVKIVVLKEITPVLIMAHGNVFLCACEV